MDSSMQSRRQFLGAAAAAAGIAALAGVSPAVGIGASPEKTVEIVRDEYALSYTVPCLVGPFTAERIKAFLLEHLKSLEAAWAAWQIAAMSYDNKTNVNVDDIRLCVDIQSRKEPSLTREKIAECFVDSYLHLTKYDNLSPYTDIAVNKSGLVIFTTETVTSPILVTAMQTPPYRWEKR